MAFHSGALFKKATGVNRSVFLYRSATVSKFFPVALYKRVTMSDSLLSLMTKESQDQYRTLFCSRANCSFIPPLLVRDGRPPPLSLAT